MSDTKFTKGPWVVEKPRWTAPTDERHVYDTHGQLIARIPLAGRFQSVNETVANANLIAAAPEMYEALERIYGRLLMSERDGDAHITEEDGAMVEAALRKARGEA